MDPGDGHDVVAAPDPTLSGLGAEPAAGTQGFPDTTAGTHLVLYQTKDGAVDLRWRIHPADIAHARAAFGGAGAQAVLRLYHRGAVGDDRLIADADLGSDTDAEQGLGHYGGSHADGVLRAEIGLANAQGGWLLVARSNALPAAAPVGAAFLREQAPAQGAPPAAAGSPDGAPATVAAAGSPGTARTPGAPEPLRPPPPAQESLPPEAFHLAPEFPLVEPEPSGLAATGVAPGRLQVQARVQTPGTGSAPGAQPPRGADGRRLPEAPAGGVVPRLAQRPPPRPPPNLPPDLPQGPARQETQAGSQGLPAPAPGSGALRPAAREATLTAELLVHGSAPPHTLLDLGGHAHRVGPGGRLQLRIPIREQEVILGVLASLPRLPVADRTDGEWQGASEAWAGARARDFADPRRPGAVESSDGDSLAARIIRSK